MALKEKLVMPKEKKTPGKESRGRRSDDLAEEWQKQKKPTRLKREGKKI